ncbi:MAG: SDR family NAD(P)-dependent oxidoreductase [Firmicutes bacterium]|nr:SDR family NAD(P)-dependent oxidoreductase [Bacillota bacterium]
MKTIIITGASSGIGYATAEALCQNGYKVYNISRGDCDIKGVINKRCDVTKTAKFVKVLEDIIAKEGEIYAGIYSAGYSLAAPIELTDDDKLRYLFDVNYFGAVTFCKTLIPSMREARNGRLVLIGSMAGQLPVPFLSAYCGTKAAVGSLAQGISQELEDYGIRCTCVMPGGTATEFTARRDKLNCHDTEYNEAYCKALANIGVTEAKGMDAKKVADLIVRNLTKKAPPLFLPVGVANTLTSAVAKFVPQELVSMYMSSTFIN